MEMKITPCPRLYAAAHCPQSLRSLHGRCPLAKAIEVAVDVAFAVDAFPVDARGPRKEAVARCNDDERRLGHLRQVAPDRERLAAAASHLERRRMRAVGRHDSDALRQSRNA